MYSARNMIEAAASVIAAAQARVLRVFLPRYGGAPESRSNRILIVKLDELGDLIMSLPLIGALQECIPGCEVTIVVNRAARGLLSGWEGVTVLDVDVKCKKALRPILLPLRYFCFVRKHLSGSAFDACLIPRRSADSVYSVVLAYLANARRRIGFAEKSTSQKAMINWGFDRLLTDVIPPPPRLQHETISNLTLLPAMGIQSTSCSVRLPTSRDGEEFAHGRLARLKGPIIALCPSAGHSELKQWGAERFCELTRSLIARDCSVVLVGSAADLPLGEMIERGGMDRIVNLIGKTSLTQLVETLRLCNSYVGNDAGPMHLASALQIPVVAVFGSSCHHRFGPWSPHSLVQVHEISCSPCLDHERDRCQVCIHATRECLDALSVQQVCDAVTSTLAKYDRSKE